MNSAVKRFVTVPLLILALLLAVAPIPAHAGETYGLSIGGVVIDNYNKDDIVAVLDSEGAVAGGSASFDPSTNTLYLTDFYYAGPGGGSTDVRAVIYADMTELNIQVSGTCGITLTSYWYEDEGHGMVCASYGCGLCFNGTTLNVYGENVLDTLLLGGATDCWDSEDPESPSQLSHSAGVLVRSGDLTVESCCLSAYAYTAVNSFGLWIWGGNLDVRAAAEVNAFGSLGYDGSSAGLTMWASGTMTIEDGSSVYGYSGSSFAASTGIAAGNIFVQESLLSGETGDNSGFSGSSTGIRCGDIWAVDSRIAGIAGRGSAGGDSVGINADSIEMAECMVTAIGDDADSFFSYGILCPEISFSSCEVHAAAGNGIESFGIYADESFSALGESRVTAESGAGYNLSCGMQLTSGSLSIDCDSEVYLTGNESEDGGSYGLVINPGNLTIEKNPDGLLVAKGHTRAMYSTSAAEGKVTLRAGFIYYSNSFANNPGYAMVPGMADGYRKLVVNDYVLYVYAKGDTRRGVTLSATVNTATGDVDCAIHSEDTFKQVYLVVASCDAAGKLVDLGVYYYGTGELIYDPSIIDDFGTPDVDPIEVGQNLFSFGEIQMAAGGSVSVFLVSAVDFTPLCAPGEVSYMN